MAVSDKPGTVTPTPGAKAQEWFFRASIALNWLLGRAPYSPCTVAELPGAAAVGAGSRGFVTDANATTFASIVAGGGSNGVPVYCDGTDWRIG